MSLTGKRVNSRSYQHTLGRGKLPDPIPAEQLTRLVVLLKTGNTAVKHPIILGHMGLAMSIVGRYLAHYDIENRSLIDDLVGEALYAVTLAVDRAVSNLMDNEITPYIVRIVHDRLGICLSTDRLIHIPIRSYNRHKGSRPPKTGALNGADRCRGNTWEVDFWDTVNRCACNSMDRKIVELRLKGRTDSEIGKVVGLSESSVAKLKRAMLERYAELEKIT